MEKETLKPVKSILFILYTIGFIFAFSSALPAYIGSSFLSVITGEKLLSFVYVACAFVTIISFIFTPRLLKRYGNYKVTLLLLGLDAFALFGLSLFHNPYFILFCFVLMYVASTVVGFCFDLFIEHNSSNKKTGEIRSIALTCVNLAWLVSPWLSGMIIGQDAYWKAYLAAAFVLLPTIYIVFNNLKDFVDPQYQEIKIGEAIQDVFQNKNITGIFVLNFLLQFFFAIMVIYIPIYLYKYIGFDWKTIGLIFSIMLVPFVLVQVPAGELADKRYGEKEMLTVSFIIMAISVALIPLIDGTSFVIWAILLFMTRVGAAIAQVMCDVYLFKSVGDANLGVINLYRAMSPVASIFAPLVAIVVFMYFPFENLFYLLALLMLCGLNFSLRLTDTN